MQDSHKRGQSERRFGAILGLGGVLAGVISGLLLTPILIRSLDKPEFGLYQLIGAFTGFLVLMDFGISGTLTRYIAKYRAENDELRKENFFSMCLIIYTVIGILTLVVGAVIYFNLGRMFAKSVTPEELPTAKLMFAIVMGSVFATILGRAYIGAIAGYERFIYSRAVTIGSMLAKIGLIAALLAWGSGAVGVVFAEAVINLLILALNFCYGRFLLRLRFKIHFWDWELFSEVMAYAFWLFITALVLQINFRMGRIVLGVMTTKALVAVYAVAMQINTIYSALPGAISQVFLPQATRMVVNKSSGEDLTRFMIVPSRYQLITLGAALSGFILFGRQFVGLWAGPDYIEAWIIGVIVMVPITIPLFQNTVIRILEAKALNRTRALINLGFAVTNGVVSVFLVKQYGLIGPAIGTCCVLLVGHGVILNLYYHYGVGLNMPLFFKETCRGILPVIIAATILGIGFVYMPIGDGWFSLITRCALYSMFYGIVMWFFGMRDRERTLVRSVLHDGILKRIIPARGNSAA
jgi:O-antigen/teichoic acid export membrane protein